jgi:hypothetical protein
VLTANRVKLLVAAGAVLALAVPLTAYVIVPLFVRSTVVERAPSATRLPAPGPSASAPGSAAPLNPTPTSLTLARGDLRRINAVDFGTGKVSLLQVGSQRFLRFDNVEIAAAPAQFVYLSDRTDGAPGNFTDLGKLKATSGSFNYEIPAGLDLSGVKSVVSWCRQFSVTVTYAVLQPGG